MNDLNDLNIPERRPGEPIKDYMIRINAHPSCKNRMKTPKHIIEASDMTHTRMGGGVIATFGEPKARAKKSSR